MKVYIIQKAGEDILGVYATKELANMELKRFQDDSNYPHHYMVDEYEVEK